MSYLTLSLNSVDDEEDKRKQAEDALSAILLPPDSTKSTESTPSSDSTSSDDATLAVSDHDIQKYSLIPEGQVKDSTPDDTKYPTGPEDRDPSIALLRDRDQPQGLPPVYPNLSPPPPEPADIKTDTDTGTRYVIDSDTGRPVPHAEIATPSDLAAFKPGDVTLPQVTAVGQAVAPRAKLIDPDPDRNYFELNRADKPVPGFVPGSQNAIVNPAAGLVTPDPTQGNLGDEELIRQILAEAPAKGKPVPGFIEGSQNAIVNPAAGVVPPTPKPKYPDQIVTPDEASGKTSVVNAPVANAPVTPANSTKPTTQSTDPVFAGIPIAGQEQAVPTQSQETRVQKGTDLTGTDSRITDIVSHAAVALPPGYTIRSTSGVRTAGQGQHTLGKAQDWQIFDPKGNPVVNRGDDSTGLYTLLARNAYGYQEKNYPELTGQFQWGGQFGTSTANNPNEPDLMHFDIGGRRGRIERYSRESIGAALPSDTGAAAVSRYGKLIPEDQAGDTSTAAQPQGSTAAAPPAGKFITGKATTFGYHDPDDDGVGSPKMGQINTNDGKLVGIAVPEGALRRQFGSDEGAWRRARVEVVGPDGVHRLMPIVDLGPGDTSKQRGVAADFTHGAAVLLNHDDSNTYQFRIIPDAGPDAKKEPGDFIAEQRALAAGQTYQPQTADRASSRYGKLIPEDQVPPPPTGSAAEQATLQAVTDHNPNKGDLWKALNTDIPGVSAPVLEAYRDKVRQQITAYALDYYKASNPKITPDEAFKTATSDPDFGTYAGEIWSKILPNFQHMGIAGARAQDVQEENTVDQFFKAVNPDSTADQRVQLKRQIMAMDPQHRRVVLGQMLTGNGDAAVADRMSTIDAPTLFDAFDHISDPVYQTNRKAEIAKAVAQNVKDLTPDPRIAETPGAIATSLLSSIPKNMLQMGTGTLGESSMMQEIYFDTYDQLKKENPSMSEDELKSKASASTAAQMGPQMIIMRLGGGALNAATKGIQQPLLELGARLGIHSTAGGLMAGVQQVMKNVTTNHPPMEGVQEAVIAGAAQTGIAAGLHGGISGHGPEAKAPEAEPPPLPIPSTERPTSEYVPPEPTLGEHGPPLDRPGTFEAPISGEQHGPAFGQLYPDKPLEGDEHGPAAFAREGTFSPGELHARISELVQENYSPEQIRAEIAQLAPDPVLQPEIARGLAPAQEPPVTLDQAIRQAKADAVAAKLGGAPPTPQTARTARTGFPTPDHAAVYNDLVARGMDADVARNYVQNAKGTTEAQILYDVQTQARGVSESDPYVSKVANKYMAQRVASGEIAPIEPGHGDSPAVMLARAAKMSPEEVNQHVSDVMNNVGGDPKENAAAIRMEEARLSQRNLEAGRAYEANPNPQTKALADEALADLNDFHNNPLAKIKSIFHHTGVILQGERAVDLANYNGIRDAWLRNNAEGKKMSPATEKAMKDSSNGLRDAMTKEKNAIREYGDGVEKLTRNKKQTAEETRLKGMRKMGFLPCP